MHLAEGRMERPLHSPPPAVSAMVLAFVLTTLGLGACGTRVSGGPGTLPTLREQQGQSAHPELGDAHQTPASIETVQPDADTVAAADGSRGPAGAAPTQVAAPDTRKSSLG